MNVSMQLRTRITRIQPFSWLVAGLIVLFLVPLWTFQYIPTQDGPSHLNNALILSDYANPAFQYSKIYDLRLDPFPNWLSHAGLAALLRVFPPLTAEKILLSLYVMAFPLAFIYFLHALDPAKKPLGLLSFAFIYNYLFMMGFYNFVFSIPLIFFTLGYFWKHRARLTLLQAVVLNGLLLLTFFGHMISYLVALGSVALIAVIQFGSQRRSFRSALASLGIQLLSLLPTIPLLVRYYLRSSFAGKIPEIDPGRIPDLLGDFFSQRVLVSYNHAGQTETAIAVAVILNLILLLSVIKRVVQRRGFKMTDTILVLFFILFALCLLMPWDFGSGAWLNDRLALLASLFLLGWCDISLPFITPRPDGADSPALSVRPDQNFSAAHSESKPGRLSRAYAGGMTLLLCAASLAVLGSAAYSFQLLEPILREYAAGGDLIQANTVLLPLNFSNGDEDFGRADPLLHANHYLTLSNGAVNLGNYEPFVDYFPVAFKPGLNLPIYLSGSMNWNDTLEQHKHAIALCSYTHMIDYLLVWGTPDYYFKLDIDQCYHLIFEKGRQKIYVPKR